MRDRAVGFRCRREKKENSVRSTSQRLSGRRLSLPTIPLSIMVLARRPLMPRLLRRRSPPGPFLNAWFLRCMGVSEVGSLILDTSFGLGILECECESSPMREAVSSVAMTTSSSAGFSTFLVLAFGGCDGSCCSARVSSAGFFSFFSLSRFFLVFVFAWCTGGVGESGGSCGGFSRVFGNLCTVVSTVVVSAAGAELLPSPATAAPSRLDIRDDFLTRNSKPSSTFVSFFRFCDNSNVSALWGFFFDARRLPPHLAPAVSCPLPPPSRRCRAILLLPVLAGCC